MICLQSFVNSTIKSTIYATLSNTIDSDQSLANKRVEFILEAASSPTGVRVQDVPGPKDKVKALFSRLVREHKLIKRTPPGSMIPVYFSNKEKATAFLKDSCKLGPPSNHYFLKASGAIPDLQYEPLDPAQDFSGRIKRL